MAGPFDTTTKYLVQTYPRDWLALLGFDPGAEVDLLDADLSTVGPLADKVVRLAASVPRLVHLEFQSTYDRTMGQRLAEYNLLLHGRHGLPVRSVLVLLRRSADDPALGGVHTVGVPGEPPDLVFRYQVARLWQHPAEALLTGPLGTLPLAPLAAPPAAVSEVVRRVERRIEREADRPEAERLKIVTFTLLGLLVPAGVAESMMPGVKNMRDSSTYQSILAEGRAEGLAEGRAEGRAQEARRLVVRLGVTRLGPPAPHVLAELDLLTDPERLEELAERLLSAASWDELLPPR